MRGHPRRFRLPRLTVRGRGCSFCGNPNHRWKDCPDRAQYERNEMEWENWKRRFRP